MIVGLDFLSEIKKTWRFLHQNQRRSLICTSIFFRCPIYNFPFCTFSIWWYILYKCYLLYYDKKKYRAYCQSSIHRVHCNPMSAEGATIWHLRGARIEFGNHKMQNSGIVMRIQYNHLLKRHVWIKKQKVRIVKTRRKNSQIEKYNPSNPSTPKKFQMDAP